MTNAAQLEFAHSCNARYSNFPTIFDNTGLCAQCLLKRRKTVLSKSCLMLLPPDNASETLEVGNGPSHCLIEKIFERGTKMQNETHRQHTHTFSFSSIIAALVLLFTSAASHGQALFEGCCSDDAVFAGPCVGLSSCTEAFIRYKENVTGGFSCEGRPVNFKSAVMFQPQSNQPGWY